MKKRIFIAACGVMIILILGCLPSPQESETRPQAFYLLAGNRLFTVDEGGTREPVEFTSAPGKENAKYEDALLSPDKKKLYLITDTFELTRLDLDYMVEVPMWELALPGGGREYIVSRLGWAGQKIYVLARSRYQGMALLEVDVLQGQQKVLLSHLDGLAGGLNLAVDFDLLPGGNEVLIAYQSGKLRTFNLYLQDSAETEVADLQEEIRGLQVLADGSVFLATVKGVYMLDPAHNLKFGGDLLPPQAMSLKDASGRVLWAALDTGQVVKVILPEMAQSVYLSCPEPVQAIISPFDTWLKKTRPIIQNPMGVLPYHTMVPPNPPTPNFFSFYFLDPEGESADVTVVMEADPAQNVSFVSGGTVFSQNNVQPHNLLDISFWGGTQPGIVIFHFTVISTDGLVSRNDYIVQVQ